jgi:hypothetical protein
MFTPRLVLGLVLVLALLAPGASQSLAQPVASPAALASPAAPGAMLIIENAGQWPEAARFQVWNSPLCPGTTWLAEDAIWLVVAGGRSQVAGGKLQVAGSEASADPLADLQPANLPPATLHALKLTFPGSNPDVRIEPFGAVDTTVSYFLGNDPEQWRPDVPVWGGVRYVDLYPGVDLILDGSQSGALSWLLETQPGVDSSSVRLRVEGGDSVALDGRLLRISTPAGDTVLPMPMAQFTFRLEGLTTHGKETAWSVPAISGTKEYSGLGVTRRLENNPASLLYSTFLGGTTEDQGAAIAIGPSNQTYIAGLAHFSNFPTTPGAFDPTQNGEWDVFVAVLNSAGNALDYATFLGGASGDYAYTIAPDSNGRATVAGATFSHNFPTTLGAYDTSFNNGDAFVVRLNPSGSALDYSTFIGGDEWDYAAAVVIDLAGRPNIAGYTNSSDFPVTPGAYDPSFNSTGCFQYGRPCFDAFVARLNASGSALEYSTYLGGAEHDQATSLGVDSSGRLTVAGSTESDDFPTTVGAFDRTFGGSNNCAMSWNPFPCSDAFVVRFNAAGSTLDYATFLGGSVHDSAAGLALDSTGQATVTGATDSPDFPTSSGAYDTTFNSGYGNDAFVVCLNAAGSALEFGTFLGGWSSDEGRSIVLDDSRRVYVVGLTQSDDFPTIGPAFDITFNGNYWGDAFVARIDATGSALDYGTFLGGGEEDYGRAIALDMDHNAYVTGGTYSSDFPTTAGALDGTFNGTYDAFVAKLNLTPYTPNVVAPIEHPAAGAFVSGTVTLRGYAIDLGSSAGTGIDVVHIYLDGPYGTGTIIGAATYGLDRPDIAAQYGARFGPSGWELAWDTAGLSPGVHRLYLYAHRTTDNAWSLMEPHLVIVSGGPARWLPIVLRQR